jgi:predicted dehydrogenase
MSQDPYPTSRRGDNSTMGSQQGQSDRIPSQKSQKSKAGMGRRSFLKSATLASAAIALPVAGVRGEDTPTKGIRVAVIGVNGRGVEHLNGLSDNVVAICDVDQSVLARRVKEFTQKHTKSDIKTFTDYRKLVEDKEIDAVSIATPNHTHTLIAIAAIQAGKDVYVEKPVCQTVWEGRQLANAAKKYGRIVQCGTQSRSSPSLRDAVAYVRSGALGKIQHVIATCYKRRPSIGKLDKPLVIAPHIDYDLWCGPAAKSDLYRPNLHYDWHWDLNTGNGDLGNQGIHQMDIARWFLGANTLSRKVTSIGARIGYEDAGNSPNTQIVLHDFAEGPLMFEVRGLPEKTGSEEMSTYQGIRVGVLVKCENGYVRIPSYSEATAYDNDDKELKTWDEGGDHFGNFLEAVAKRDPKILNAEVTEGYLSSALCHTGMVAHQLGKPIPFAEIASSNSGQPLLSDAIVRLQEHLEANGLNKDSTLFKAGAPLAMNPSTEKFIGDDAANALLHREDRAPFKIPQIDV